MHIIQNSWLHGGTVPPAKYGGIERMVGVLSAELVRQGHQVTLIAPAGSFVEGCEMIECNDLIESYNILQTLKADVIHDHSCWALESPVRQSLRIPTLSTTHVNHAIGWKKNVVYLSVSQRTQHGLQLQADLSQSPVVYVPINPALKPIGHTREEFLLYLGMVSEYKGVIDAANVAQHLGRKLIVAGPAWGEYADKVKAHPSVEYVGEVGDPYRSQLLEQAYAVMCLHNNAGGWQEPGCGVFGEAMAFGTPVGAFPNGCLPELVGNGQNGWLTNTVDDMATFIDHMKYPTEFSPYVTAFSAESIVHQYVELYEQIAQGKVW